MSFMDLELKRVLGRFRSQQFLSEVEKQINWAPIEQILLSSYPTGKSGVGNSAYPPLMLLKAVLRQSWFGMNSDSTISILRGTH